MTTDNVVTLLPSNKRDAALIAQCATFIQIETEIADYERAHASNSRTKQAPAPPHEREDEGMALLHDLCQRRAASLHGIAARVRTLLCYAPDRFRLNETDGYDELMIAALLRDLASVLKAHGG